MISNKGAVNGLGGGGYSRSRDKWGVTSDIKNRKNVTFLTSFWTKIPFPPPLPSDVGLEG